jgi:cytochrome c-type biogenesis protein
MENVSLLAAFGAGLASFVSPCVLPLIPVYFASLVGADILEVSKNIKRIPVFLHSLSFILGFSLVFVLMGTMAGLIGVSISPNSLLVRVISGSLLLFFGLFMLAAIKIPQLNFEKRLSPKIGISSGYFRSLLVGGAFALAWTPCVGPILGSVLTLALNSDTAWQGAYLLAIYSLGLGLPFLLIGVAFDFIIPLIKYIQKYSKWIYIASGIVLILVGVLILTNNLTWLYL